MRTHFFTVPVIVVIIEGYSQISQCSSPVPSPPFHFGKRHTRFHVSLSNHDSRIEFKTVNLLLTYRYCLYVCYYSAEVYWYVSVKQHMLHARVRLQEQQQK